jgi:hypothetical protein
VTQIDLIESARNVITPLNRGRLKFTFDVSIDVCLLLDPVTRSRQ